MVSRALKPPTDGAKRGAGRESEAASKKPKKPVNDFWSLGLKAAVAHDPTLRHLPQLVADLAEVQVADVDFLLVEVVDKARTELHKLAKAAHGGTVVLKGPAEQARVGLERPRGADIATKAVVVPQATAERLAVIARDEATGDERAAAEKLVQEGKSRVVAPEVLASFIDSRPGEWQAHLAANGVVRDAPAAGSSASAGAGGGGASTAAPPRWRRRWSASPARRSGSSRNGSVRSRGAATRRRTARRRTAPARGADGGGAGRRGARRGGWRLERGGWRLGRRSEPSLWRSKTARSQSGCHIERRRWAARSRTRKSS